MYLLFFLVESLIAAVITASAHVFYLQATATTDCELAVMTRAAYQRVTSDLTQAKQGVRLAMLQVLASTISEFKSKPISTPM